MIPAVDSDARSAYVHVPFCRHRCGYCNFSVIADRDDLIDRYIQAIRTEIARAAPTARQPLETLFIGGGTPTHLPPKPLAALLTHLRESFDFARTMEWSVEANPEDITEEKLRLLVDFGVNRISLGVQSFQDSKLSQLERGHRGDDAIKRIELAADFIPKISADLIFAAPGESLKAWQRDLEIVTRLPLKHVSTYALTFEKGTSFWARRQKTLLHAVDEETELAMYDLAREHLETHGLHHYEISNFAADASECRHNLAYWRGEPWYAFGPGAAAYLGNRRTVNHRSTTTYLKKIESGESPIAETDEIDRDQALREAAAFGIRLIDGIRPERLSD
ncbi:MAG: radical SAM family heme chaperone HemW, partial [Planctomycetota bacterium]